jgi:hypothetical protein
MKSLEARLDFEQAVKIFQGAFNPKKISGQPNPNFNPDWDPVTAFKLTQATLRLEQPLSATTTQYLFPVLNNIQNQGAPFNTEVRLPQQDSFVPTHLGIYLGLPSSSTDASFKLITWASPFVFTNAATMQTIYNGQLKLMINNVQYIVNWDLWRHWKTTQTQQTAAFGAGSPEDQFDGSEDALYPMQPFVLLIGSQNIQLTITLPAAPSAVDANSRLIVLVRGIQAQNSTVVS